MSSFMVPILILLSYFLLGCTLFFGTRIFRRLRRPKFDKQRHDFVSEASIFLDELRKADVRASFDLMLTHDLGEEYPHTIFPGRNEKIVRYNIVGRDFLISYVWTYKIANDHQMYDRIKAVRLQLPVAGGVAFDAEIRSEGGLNTISYRPFRKQDHFDELAIRDFDRSSVAVLFARLSDLIPKLQEELYRGP